MFGPSAKYLDFLIILCTISCVLQTVCIVYCGKQEYHNVDILGEWWHPEHENKASICFQSFFQYNLFMLIQLSDKRQKPHIFICSRKSVAFPGMSFQSKLVIWFCFLEILPFMLNHVTEQVKENCNTRDKDLATQAA